MKNKNGRVIWITGLSGAGKSELAKLLVQDLRRTAISTILLDGDELRKVFLIDPEHTKNYTRSGRLALSLQYARLCQLLSSQGFNVVIATISMFQEVYIWNRENLSYYFEVFLDVPLDELCRRDSKGIYKRYYAGDLNNVAGLDLAIDVPEDAHWRPEFKPGRSASSLARELTEQLEVGIKHGNFG